VQNGNVHTWTDYEFAPSVGFVSTSEPMVANPVGSVAPAIDSAVTVSASTDFTVTRSSLGSSRASTRCESYVALSWNVRSLAVGLGRALLEWPVVAEVNRCGDHWFYYKRKIDWIPSRYWTTWPRHDMCLLDRQDRDEDESLPAC